MLQGSRGGAVSPPAGFDEKTTVFGGKKFGLSVPAPGEDMASPLHHRGGKLSDKPEFVLVQGHKNTAHSFLGGVGGWLVRFQNPFTSQGA